MGWAELQGADLSSGGGRLLSAWQAPARSSAPREVHIVDGAPLAKVLPHHLIIDILRSASGGLKARLRARGGIRRRFPRRYRRPVDRCKAALQTPHPSPHLGNVAAEEARAGALGAAAQRQVDVQALARAAAGCAVLSILRAGRAWARWL